jgi:chromobox protein 1
MDVLKAYWDKIGGKPQAKPKTPAKKGTKRKSMAQHTPEPEAASTTKRRGRKSLKTADEPTQDKTPSLPEGSWEDHVQSIDVVEKPDSGVNKGVLMVYLLWEDDSRTQHTAQQCRQKCPQKVNLCPASAIYHPLTCNS